MRHRVAGRKLGRSSAHRKALFRNLVTELLRHEQIRTTEAKAKAIRPQAEQLITLANRGDLHARRLAARDVQDPEILRKLFDEIAPRYQDRPGGYTRITKLSPRKGDAAPMAMIELERLSKLHDDGIITDLYPSDSPRTLEFWVNLDTMITDSTVGCHYGGKNRDKPGPEEQ